MKKILAENPELAEAFEDLKAEATAIFGSSSGEEKLMFILTSPEVSSNLVLSHGEES